MARKAIDLNDKQINYYDLVILVQFLITKLNLNIDDIEIPNNLKKYFK